MNPALLLSLLLPTTTTAPRSPAGETIKPTRTEIVSPIRNETFNQGGKAREPKQGGNPREMNGVFMFDGSMDGDRQVDPQVAVGNGYVFHGSNGGLIIGDNQGKRVEGVSQSAFNYGIDPKLFFGVLIGFQETGPNMYISPRFTYRLARDRLGTTRPIVHLGEGEGATAGGPWGDYSGSVGDGDNMVDFWTIQSVATAKGGGGSVIARIRPGR